jgi:hypothetical protein
MFNGSHLPPQMQIQNVALGIQALLSEIYELTMIFSKISKEMSCERKSS